ncbi:hypothetical protein VTO73DRAFT_12120 [Trametes versicolor]
MPRFLNTQTGQFVLMGDPRTARYAILSHTWRSSGHGEEQSYADVRKLQAAAALEDLRNSPEGASSNIERNSFFSHPELSSKISGICKVARDAGYELIWIDSCCIDTASSAELSEAINSMYEWYSRADICYVYLTDVPDGEDPAAETSAFSQSRWHRRGWTLQELIAPKHVVFLTSRWSFLGTKVQLAPAISRVTGVDISVLTGVASLESISVSRRMSWAADRETTRIEDEAYCLLGIFGVRMSPIYGEGRHAFLRLQEEIIRTIPDQSIFAWGPRHVDLLALDTARTHPPNIWHPCEEGLLATSPREFVCANNITPLSISEFARHLGRTQDIIPPLHCVFTPQGVRVRLLCVDLALLDQVIPAVMQTGVGTRENRACDDCRGRGVAHYLGILQCVDSAGSLVALPLCRPRPGPREHGSLVVATHITCGALNHDPYHSVRLARTLMKGAFPLLPVEVFICRTTPPAHTSHVWSPMASWDHCGRPSAIRIAPWCRDDLRALGFGMSPVDCRLERLATGEGLLHFSLTLTRPRERHVLSAGDRNDWEQYIQIQLELSHQWYSQTLVASSSVHFSVNHYYPLPPVTSSGPTLAALDPAGPAAVEVLQAHPSSRQSPPKEPGVGTHHEFRSLLWEVQHSEDSTYLPSTQARTQATYVLRSDADCRKESFRILQLSLQAQSIPRSDASWPHTSVDTLWLSPPAVDLEDIAYLPYASAEDTLAQDDAYESGLRKAELDASDAHSVADRSPSLFSAVSAPSRSSSTYGQVDLVARLMQRVEELQREVDDTRAEMAAMSSELRAIATTSERRPRKRRRIA